MPETGPPCLLTSIRPCRALPYFVLLLSLARSSRWRRACSSKRRQRVRFDHHVCGSDDDVIHARRRRRRRRRRIGDEYHDRNIGSRRAGRDLRRGVLDATERHRPTDRHPGVPGPTGRPVPLRAVRLGHERGRQAARTTEGRRRLVLPTAVRSIRPPWRCSIPKGQVLDQLDPGASGDLLVVVDAPVADQLTDAQPSFGLAQR